QYIFGVRQMLAEKFSIPEKNVRVLAPFVGGGFGSKGLAWPHVALCAAAARAVRRPVKLALTREQMFACVGYRSPTRQRVALGAEKFGWARRNPKPRSMREGRFLVGMGVATAFYPYYRFPAAARVRMDADGSALVQCGAQEMGMGTATVHTLLVADLLGLPLAKVRTEHGDTNLPFAAVAGGSTTTVSAGSAIASACNALKTKLIDLARQGDGPLRTVGPDA